MIRAVARRAIADACHRTVFCDLTLHAAGAPEDDARPVRDGAHPGWSCPSVRGRHQRPCGSQHRQRLGWRHACGVQGDYRHLRASGFPSSSLHYDVLACALFPNAIRLQDALETAFALYAQRMAVEAPQASLPFDDEALTLIHEKARIASIEGELCEPQLLVVAVSVMHHLIGTCGVRITAEYERKAVGPAAERYRQQLKERVAAEWRLQSSANAAASDAACSRLISSLWHTIIEPKLLLTHVDGPAAGHASPSTSVASSAASGAAAEPAAGGSAAGHDLWPVYGDHEAFAADLVSGEQPSLRICCRPIVPAFCDNALSFCPLHFRVLQSARRTTRKLGVRLCTARLPHSSATRCPWPCARSTLRGQRSRSDAQQP